MLKLLFSPKGKVKRNPFWMGTLVCICLSLACLIIWLTISYLVFDTVLGVSADADIATVLNASFTLMTNHPKWAKFLWIFNGIISPGILLVFAVFIMWMQLSLIIKRLADLKVAKWIVVLPFIIVLIGLLRLYRVWHLNLHLALQMSAVMIVVFYLFLLCWPSRQEA